MKKVRILCGGYGLHTPGKRGVKLILCGQTVELPDAEADELARSGMAEYAEDSRGFTPDLPAAGDDCSDPGVDTSDTDPPAEGEKTAFLAPEQFEDMNFAQLKKLAKEMNLDITGVRSKAALIEMICAEPVAPGEEEPDDEAPPDLTAEEPIV